MKLTIKDLEILVNDHNKELYNIIYDIILNQFGEVLKHIDYKNINFEKEKALGTCGIYLSSLVELLNTLRDLMDKGYIESGGIIAAACWERALTLRKILINPVLNSQIHTDHEQAKKTPWKINQMVKDIIKHEHQLKNTTSVNKFEETSFYMQYTFLCSIKHGNPYTISHLYRPGFSSEEKLFVLKPNNSLEDKDLIKYIKILVIDNALDALIDFSRNFRTTYEVLNQLRVQVNNLINDVKLQVPKLLNSSPKELGQEYWDHLFDIENNNRF